MLSIVHLLLFCATVTKTNLFNLDYLILKSVYQTYTFSIPVWKISDDFKDHLTLACDTKLRMTVFSAEYSIHIKNIVKDKIMKFFSGENTLEWMLPLKMGSDSPLLPMGD